MPICINFIISSLAIGGAEKQLFTLLEKLNRDLFRPLVTTYCSGPYESRIRKLNIPVEVIPYDYNRLYSVYSTFKSLRVNRPTIVHTIGHTANYIGRSAAFLARVPIIIIGERNSPTIKNSFALMFDRLLSPVTSHLITNSKHAAQFYIERSILPSSKISTVYNGIDTTFYKIKRKSKSNFFKIGYVGHLHFQKNHSLLLNSFSLLLSNYSRIKLYLAGDGELKTEIKSQIEELKINNNVILTGLLNDVPSFLNDMDIYVHTARYEGFPNALMEAMACGLPCAVLDVPGCNELIEQDGTGILVPPENPEALADALLRLIRDPEFCTKIGNKARSFVQDEFSVEKMINSTTLIYQKLLNSIGL